jgi:REP element-mobilizing transposase RayT
MLKTEIRDELHAYTGGVLRSEKWRLLKAGGISDHIHILAQLNATVSVANCVQKIKTNTSRKKSFREEPRDLLRAHNLEFEKKDQP